MAELAAPVAAQDGQLFPVGDKRQCGQCVGRCGSEPVGVHGPGHGRRADEEFLLVGERHDQECMVCGPDGGDDQVEPVCCQVDEKNMGQVHRG
ncbi:hypothetical protein ABZ351_34975 [Streptomyces microflavus]|uniref:hypothetical protein n=1 Tax=Streptomyces microflavus TaxID=1919 RepID=UPI0033CC2E41